MNEHKIHYCFTLSEEQLKVKSEDEIREEAALHLSSLSIPRSERTHV